MRLKRIKALNTPQFLLDVKLATSVMVYAKDTEEYFKTTKKEVLREAESSHIRYYMSRNIFKVNRLVMVIT